MYIVRKTMPSGIAFKTFDGWVYRNKMATEALDLNGVQRFTAGEAQKIELPKGQEFIWFGCYERFK